MLSNRRDFLKTLVVPLTMAATVACSPAEEGEKTAQAFMESYYVELDLTKAGQFTSGLAEEKIKKQEGLMQGVRPDTPGQKPQVVFKLIKKEMGQDQATYYYQVSTSRKILGTTEVMVRVRKENGQWKVSNFSESGTE